MDELLGRKIPHSAEAEQAVLGSVLIDPTCIADILTLISPADFYISVNRDIFETIYAMFSYSQVIDPVTILEQMRVRGVFREESSQDYIRALMDITPTAANVMRYAAIVRDRALMRRLYEVAGEIENTVIEGVGEADEMLELAERKIYGLRQGRNSGGLVKISTVVETVYSALSRAATEGTELPGLSTGFTRLDSSILGLKGGDLIILAARPGMGKTSLALNLAINVAKKTPKAVVFFSLEMTNEQLVSRLISSEAKIDGKKLQTGKLSFHEWEEFLKISTEIRATNILLSDNATLTVADMNAQCRRVQNLGLVIIDYLQLMQNAGGRGHSGENRQQVVSEMSRMLKIMAKELNVPVICGSQLSREGAKRGLKPQLWDLRESGSIEQDADIVIGLHRDDETNPSLTEALILKNRNGDTGVVRLTWVPEHTTFMEREDFRDEEDMY